MKVMRMTRSTLLTLALAALAVGLVILLGVQLDRATQNEVVTRFSQHQLLLAEQTAAAIQSIFDEAGRDLAQWPHAPDLENLVKALDAGREDEIASRRAMAEQCWVRFLSDHPIYAQIRYVDASGQEIVGVDNGGEAVRVIPQNKLRSQAEREFFLAAMALDAGEIYVSLLEPALGHSGVGGGLPTVRLATPVFDSRGRRAGIVVLNLMPGEIRAHVARLSAEEGVEAWVLDETGVEIINVAHPELEGTNAYEYCQQTGDETLIALGDDMLAGGRGTGVYLWPESVGGPLVVKKLMAYAPVLLAEGHLWSVGTSVTYDSILAAHRQTHRMLLLLGGSIITAILAGAVLVARSDRRRAVPEEQARFDETLRRRVEDLSFLNETARALSTSLDQQELLTSLLHKATAMLKAEAGSICLREEDGDLRLALAVGPHAEQVQGRRLPFGEGVVGWSIREGQPAVVPDVREDPRWYSGVDDGSGFVTRSILCLPLRIRGETIGALELLNKAGAFGQDDLQLMESVTAQAAIAIENARLYEESCHRAEEQKGLARIAALASSTLEIDELIEQIMGETMRMLSSRGGMLLLLDEEQGELTARYLSAPHLTEEIKASWRIPIDAPGFEDGIFARGGSYFCNDVAGDPNVIPAYRPHIQALKIHNFAGVALRLKDRSIGELYVGGRTTDFGPEDTRLLLTIAGYVTNALENARLYEQAQHRLESLTNLNRASQVVTSSLDVKEVLGQIVALAGSVVNSDYTSAVLLDERDKPMLGTEDLRGVRPVARRIRSDGITHHVLDSGQPVVVDTISDEGAMSPPLRRPDGELIAANPDIVAAGIRSFAVVPIQARERTLGVLFVHSRQPHAFHGQLPLLTTFANQAAVAIENARLYEQAQQEIAERKRAEETLRESQQRFQDIARNTGDWIWEVDAEGRYTYSSEIIEHVLGYSPREVLGKYFYDFFVPEEREALKTAALETFRRQEPFIGFVNRNVHRDGRVVTLETSGIPLLDAEGNLLGYRGADRDVTARLQAQEALKRRATQLATLGEVGRQITSLLELDPLLDHIVNLTREAFDYRYVSILLVDAATEELALRAGAGFEVEPAKTLRLRVGEEGICGWVAASGEPLLVGDVSQEPRFYPIEVPADTSSELAVPIQVKGHVVGVLDVQSAELEAFDEDDLFTLQTLADQVGVGIQNARLFEAEQRRRQELEGLQATTASITAMLDLEGLLQMIVKQGAELFNAPAASLMLWDERGENLAIRASWGLSDAYVQKQRIPRERVYAAATPEGEFVPLVTPDVRETPFGQLDLIKEERLCTVLIAPLVKSGQPTGVLNIYSRDEPREFSPHEIRLAETLADQAAIAIENTGLYQETHRRAERLAAVNRIARAASATLHLDDLMERVYQEVVPTLQADAFFIALYDGETNELDFRIRVDEGVREPLERRPLGPGLTAFVVTEKEPLLIQDFEEEQDRLPPAQVWGTMKVPPSWLGVPLLVGDRVVGVISVQAYRPHAYGEEEQVLLSTIADQVAVAVENARLFEAEREQRELAEALEAAAAAVSSTLEPNEVLDRILEQVERIVTGDASNIMLVEDSTARAVRWRGYERMGVEEQIASFALPLTGYPSLAKMAQTGEPVITTDTAANPDWVPQEGWEWLRSYVGAPIRVMGLTVGFLNVDGTRPGQFGPADARRLQAFAGHAATAIENAGLYQELRNHAEQLEQRVQERTAEVQIQYARLEAILRSTSNGVTVTDAEGEILRANPVAQTWLTQTLSPEDARRLREVLRDLARRAEERPEMVLELTGLDLQVNAAPISEPEVEGAEAVVCIHDVSHLKALDRMKSRFVSNVSHELRTPVTTIKLYAALMRRTPPEKWGEYLDALDREAERQAGLVEDILQISRIDAGRLEMKPRPTSLNELTEAAVSSHQVLAQNRGLSLEHRPAEPGTSASLRRERSVERSVEPPVALVDPQQMMQVLNNLVRNGIQYTPEGGQVVVSTAKEEAEGRVWATVTVADTGMGIPEEELPRIFERFFRGEEPRLMQVPGTGLGLAIAKEIVELHGGRVMAESQVGEGTTLTVWLPLADE